MNPPSLTTTYEDYPNHIEYKLVGDLVLAILPEFERKVENGIHNHWRKKLKIRTLVFYMERVTRIDSSGLAFLIKLRSKFNPIYIVGIQDQNWEVLKRLGMANIFKLHRHYSDFMDDKEFLGLIH